MNVYRFSKIITYGAFFGSILSSNIPFSFWLIQIVIGLVILNFCLLYKIKNKSKSKLLTLNNILPVSLLLVSFVVKDIINMSIYSYLMFLLIISFAILDVRMSEHILLRDKIHESNRGN